MKKLFSIERLYDVAGVFLIAALPFLIFVKHAGYSLFAPEILIIFGMILGFALFCGLLMIIAGTPARLVIFTWLAVLIVDIQTDWITTVGLRLLLNAVFFGALFWFLRRRLTRLVVVVVGLMFLASAVIPGESRVAREGEPSSRAGDNPDLPFVLHLILDEMIGIEGIPAEFDPGREVAAEFRDFYLDNSFAVFGRAYSRYNSTRESLPSILNFAPAGEPGYWLGEKFRQGILLENNLWFDMLHEQGYRIHVVETGHMRFFDPGETGTNAHGDTRLSYTAATIKPIESADLTVTQKIPFILSTYFMRSYFLKMAGTAYSGFAFSKPGRALALPRWELLGHYPGPLATMQVMDIMEEQLSRAGPGQAYFAHLVMPHSPYGYDRDCRMELQPGKWLYRLDYSLAPRNNTPEGRAARYPLYLGQSLCMQSRLETIFKILKDKGLWEKAIVIVHGDHGSRISLFPTTPAMRDKVSAADFLDDYSTFFAVKGPQIEGGYFRQLLPIDHIFRRVIKEEAPPDDADLENNPWVYLLDLDKLMVKHPMPPFAHGRILDNTP